MTVSTAAIVESVISLSQEDKDADDDHRVVNARDDDARREAQVEAEREVEHDEHDRDGDRVAGAVAKLLARLGPDPLDAQRASSGTCRGRALAQARR